MNMDQFWAAFWSIVLTAIITLLTWLVKKLGSWLSAKTTDVKAKNFISKIEDIVIDSANCTKQTFVDDLKKENKFDNDAQKIAKAMTYDLVINQLTPKMKDFINENYGDIKEYISTKIESVVSRIK